MARDYNFSNSYTPEQAYATPMQFQRGSYWSNQQGGSAARGQEPEREAGVTVEVNGEQPGLRAGQIMSNMREAEGSQAAPQRDGFKTSQDSGKAFSEGNTALNNAQANAMSTALKGTGQAMMDRKQGFDDLIDWMGTETRNIQAQNEQKADSRKKGGGGIFGAIGTIAGSIIGGPIGAGVGALGSLFG